MWVLRSLRFFPMITGKAPAPLPRGRNPNASRLSSREQPQPRSPSMPPKSRVSLVLGYSAALLLGAATAGCYVGETMPPASHLCRHCCEGHGPCPQGGCSQCGGADGSGTPNGGMPIELKKVSL